LFWLNLSLYNKEKNCWSNCDKLHAIQIVKEPADVIVSTVLKENFGVGRGGRLNNQVQLSAAGFVFKYKKNQYLQGSLI
jgi:hypothetical protein